MESGPEHPGKLYSTVIPPLREILRIAGTCGHQETHKIGFCYTACSSKILKTPTPVSVSYCCITKQPRTQSLKAYVCVIALTEGSCEVFTLRNNHIAVEMNELELQMTWIDLKKYNIEPERQGT